jgi:hypothetical protein
MKPLFIVTMAIMSVAAVGQPPAAINTKSIQTGEKYWSSYFDNLQSMGVETRNDSMIVREEVVKLFGDSLYRRLVYPDQYTWKEAILLLREMELKRAFWHMLNLYETDSANRSYVLGTFVAYDSLMSMDKILLSTYYTYAFADPRVSRIKDNKPDIFRPDLLERGLVRLKDIIAQIWYYREKRLGKK